MSIMLISIETLTGKAKIKNHLHFNDLLFFDLSDTGNRENKNQAV